MKDNNIKSKKDDDSKKVIMKLLKLKVWKNLLNL